ncbi:Hypothetical predicted protein [Cloeon dipterum]|uniref:Myb-like domain-containing protein n=1 Tax=Cloeon dipterum TaxID=197152 RepID=A0A8S1CEN4_9INSE|nr:Hypothetical predicted protein [Cloeon dipterum]
MANNVNESLNSLGSTLLARRKRLPSPENVVVILPDESCFEYAVPEKSKKARTEVKVNWSKEQTDALIQEYKENQIELEKPDTNKGTIWDGIAHRLNLKFGSVHGSENCMAKWRSLKNTFKKVEFSSRGPASKKKWAFYEVMCSILGDEVRDPEPMRAEPTQPTIKIITEPTAVLSTLNPTASQEELHYPIWFKQFYQAYRKNEEMKIAMLAKIRTDIKTMADRQCAAIEQLARVLSKDSV